MAKISNLKDKQGNVLYPITSTSALVDSNGQQFQPAKQGDSYTKAESDGRYINQGGTLTAPLTVTGGDSSTAGKLQFDANGQITKKDTTNTIFGLSGNDLLVGHSSLNTQIRGNNVYINGHKAITDETIKTVRTWQVGYNSANSGKGWYKFLTFNWNGTETYANYDMHILVSSNYANYFSGVLHLNPRWDTNALASGMCVEWDWIGGNKQFTADSVKVVRSNNKIECYIYQPIDTGWHFIGFSILHESRRLYSSGISYEFNTVNTAPLSSVSNVWITSTKAGNGEDFQLDTEVMTNTKWIDGRPIYRLTKLITPLPNNSSWTNLFYLGTSTIGQVIKIEGLVREGANYLSIPTAEGSYYRNLRYNKDTGYIQTINNGFTGDAYVTVYYEKT